MSEHSHSQIGLFSADPWSPRVTSLHRAFERLGIDAVHVVPWKICRSLSSGIHRVTVNNIDIADLETLLVVDIGGLTTGSFLNRIGLLTAIEEMGVTVINSVKALLTMRNKAECLRRLSSAGLCVPKTLVTESIEDAAQFARRHSPCVIKPLSGFGGTGVQLIEREFDLDNIYDYLKFHSLAFSTGGVYLLQEYIRGHGFDIRALVCDNDIITTMQRTNSGKFVTNIHSGGIQRENNIDVKDVALTAADAVRARFAGVDILPDTEGQLWVLEVNGTPGWEGAQEVTEVDIAEQIAERIIRRL